MPNQYTPVPPEVTAALEALAAAAEDYERIAYVKHAAKVKRDLLIRAARAAGASITRVKVAGIVGSDTINRICEEPPPELHKRPVDRRRYLDRTPAA